MGSVKTSLLKKFTALAAALLLSACIVEQDTRPELVDPTVFATFEHTSGVFSLEMPPTWVVSDRSDARALHVLFSPPDSQPLLSVYVLSTATVGPLEGDLPSAEQSNALLDAYLADQYPVGTADFAEMGREAQPDGSLRLTLLRTDAQGIRQFNDFAQVYGPYFVVLSAQLPNDAAQLRTLSLVINTLRVNTQAGWASASADGAQNDGQAVGFSGLHMWSTRAGGFEISGQVLNQAETGLEFIRVRARLFDAENRLLLEQDDFVAADLVAPGGYAPFRITFSDPLPPGAVRYDLDASARYADYQARTYYGPETLRVSAEAEFEETGVLSISGQVRNEGDRPAGLVKVIVTVLDAEGRVIGADTTLVDVQRLAPGETSPFSVTFFELGGTPQDFVVTSEGLVEE